MIFILQQQCYLKRESSCSLQKELGELPALSILSPRMRIIFQDQAIRSNFLGTNFILDDTQPPYSSAHIPPLGRLSGIFSSKKVSPKVPSGSSNMAHITYEPKVLGPRRMHCIMQSIPANEDEGEKSTNEEEGEKSKFPLVLKNKAPRWHEKLQCWCLNFRGRVTIPSVKNFQLIASHQPAPVVPPPPATAAGGRATSSQPAQPPEVMLQFGKVGKDMFTMESGYPLSAFQAFAICLSSFDTKLACE